MVAQAAHGRVELGVVRRDGAALPRGHDLPRVEGEAGECAERAARRSPVRRAERACGILEQRDLLRHGRLERLPLDGPAEQVHRDHRLRLRRDRLGDLRRVHVERVRVDVDEHGAGAGELDDVRGRGERVRGNDHLVARADAEREDAEVQRRGAGRDDRGVCRSDGVRQRVLELVDLRAHRELPAREHLGHGRELGLADVRSRQPDPLGQAAGAPRCARYHAIVRARPSSSSTFASKPSRRLALSMFGMRSSTSV